MFRMLRSTVLLVAAVGVAHVGILASGSSAPAPSGGGSSSLPSMTPEERAVAAYKSGDDHRVKGKKLEEEAAAKKGTDAEKTTAKARSEFEKSLKDFTNAAKLNPKLAPAYNGMGYAYRKTGDYAKALEMYDKALALAPGFPDAVEYRGEAYLGMNRVDDAKQAYLELFASDRKQADILMKAMSDWVAKRRVDAAGADPASVSALESWIKERSALAGQTASMALAAQHDTWR